jgi:hypothetical protein
MPSALAKKRSPDHRIFLSEYAVFLLVPDARHLLALNLLVGQTWDNGACPWDFLRQADQNKAASTSFASAALLFETQRYLR